MVVHTIRTSPLRFTRELRRKCSHFFDGHRRYLPLRLGVSWVFCSASLISLEGTPRASDTQAAIVNLSMSTGLNIACDMLLLNQDEGILSCGYKSTITPHIELSEGL